MRFALIYKIVVCAGCVAFGALFGCAPRSAPVDPKNPAVLKENQERTRLGLRNIGPRWICFRNLGGKEEWITDSGKQAADKTVLRSQPGAIDWEEDSYRSGRVVFIDDQHLEEQLIIHYDYRTGRGELIYIGDDRAFEAKIDAVNGRPTFDVLAVADEILKTWGIPRF